MHAFIVLTTLIRTRTTICITYTSILVKHVLRYSSHQNRVWSWVWSCIIAGMYFNFHNNSSNKSDGGRANARAIMIYVYLLSWSHSFVLVLRYVPHSTRQTWTVVRYDHLAVLRRILLRFRWLGRPGARALLLSPTAFPRGPVPMTGCQVRPRNSRTKFLHAAKHRAYTQVQWARRAALCGHSARPSEVEGRREPRVWQGWSGVYCGRGRICCEPHGLASFRHHDGFPSQGKRRSYRGDHNILPLIGCNIYEGILLT